MIGNEEAYNDFMAKTTAELIQYKAGLDAYYQNIYEQYLIEEIEKIKCELTDDIISPATMTAVREEAKKLFPVRSGLLLDTFLKNLSIQQTGDMEFEIRSVWSALRPYPIKGRVAHGGEEGVGLPYSPTYNIPNVNPIGSSGTYEKYRLEDNTAVSNPLEPLREFIKKYIENILLIHSSKLRVIEEAPNTVTPDWITNYVKKLVDEEEASGNYIIDWMEV